MTHLKRSFAAATNRIRHYRTTYPALEDNESGFYVDGSHRRDFGSTGFAEPSFRMWEIGRVRGRMVYIYQKIDLSQYKRGSFAPEVDIDDYCLAIEDRSLRTYGGYQDGIARIKLSELVKNDDFTVDMIIEITDLLAAFFVTDAVFQKAIKEFSKEIYHSSQNKLVFA